MKANELRIGNWVIYERTSHQILGVYKDHIVHRWKNDDKDAIEYESTFLDIEPIPLTPEILEKCGFKEDENVHLWINLQTHYLELINAMDGYYPIYAQLPELSSESEQRVSLNRINYVHQLQNLIFALTGEELEIAF